MKADELASKTKKDLLDLARKHDIGGRTAMSKDELVRALVKVTGQSSGSARGSEAAKTGASQRSAGKRKPAGAEATRDSGQRGSTGRSPEPASGRQVAAESRGDKAPGRRAAAKPPARKEAPPSAARRADQDPGHARVEQPSGPSVEKSPAGRETRRETPPTPPPPPKPEVQDIEDDDSQKRFNLDAGPQSGLVRGTPNWQSGRGPRESGQDRSRRGMAPHDPALKLSRVEEIRKTLPGRPSRPGRHGPDSGVRNGLRNDPRGDRRPQGQPPRGGAHPGRRDDRYGGKPSPGRPGGPGSQDRRQGGGGPPGARRDFRNEDRGQRAREDLRRSGEARRGSPYTPQFDRRDPRGPVDAPRPAAIPERLAQTFSTSPGGPQPPRPPRPETERKGGHPLELPQSYGVDRLVFMVRDPYWIHAYWEVTPATIERARQMLGEHWDGHRWVLRVQSEVNGSHFDVDLVHDARSWYIQVPEVNRVYRGMVGILTRSGVFHPFARSNKVTTPTDRMSDVTDVEFASTLSDQAQEEIVHLSGGPDLLSSPSMRNSSAEAGATGVQKFQEGWFSGMLGSMGSAGFAHARHGRGFWFTLNTELIVYGATEPTAKVTVQGRPIQLRPDGTFTLRFQLPDGVQEIPCVATSADGASERTISPTVRRQTTASERESATSQDAEI